VCPGWRFRKRDRTFVAWNVVARPSARSTRNSLADSSGAVTVFVDGRSEAYVGPPDTSRANPLSSERDRSSASLASTRQQLPEARPTWPTDRCDHPRQVTEAALVELRAGRADAAKTVVTSPATRSTITPRPSTATSTRPSSRGYQARPTGQARAVSTAAGSSSERSSRSHSRSLARRHRGFFRLWAEGTDDRFRSMRVVPKFRGRHPGRHAARKRGTPALYDKFVKAALCRDFPQPCGRAPMPK
jgi:hypothetical protein